MDVKIFCEMGFAYYAYTSKHRRPSSKEIGRKLGLDEKTVRLRVDRMEKEGFIHSYQAIPNPCLFQLPIHGTYGFRVPNVLAKQLAIQKLLQAQGIIEVGDFLGETLALDLAASSEQDAETRIKEISELIGFPSILWLPPRPFPDSRTIPDRLDWELIKALRYDAIRPTTEIAKELGVTYRIAEYRISKLLEAQVLFLRAFTNPRDSKGIVLFSLSLELDEERHEVVKHDLLERHKGRLWFEFSPPVPFIVMNMFATSLGEAEDILLESLEQQGVRSGSLTFIKRMLVPSPPSWIDRLVEQRILGA